MVSDVPAVAITEAASAIRVPIITITVRRHRMERSGTRVPTQVLAQAVARTVAALLAALVLVAVIVEAAVAVPLVVAHAQVAVVVASADKRIVPP